MRSNARNTGNTARRDGRDVNNWKQSPTQPLYLAAYACDAAALYGI